MTSPYPGYNMKMSFSQISSWHGDRQNTDSIHMIRYYAHKTGPSQSYSAVELRSFTFPNTIPNIMDWSSSYSLKNNVLAWSDNGGNYTANIPHSMYDGPTLAAELQSLMDTAYGSSVYTVTYDIISGLFSFVTTSGGNISFTPGANFPWLELGFKQGVTVTGAGGTLLSTCVAQLQGSSHIYISIPEIQTGNSIVYNGTSITFMASNDKSSTFVDNWSYQYSAPNKFYVQPTERTVSGYSIYLYFERAGVLYPLIMDANSSYELNLAYFSLQI